VILASFDVVNSQIPIAVIHFLIPFFFDDESPLRDPPGLGAPSSGYSAFVPGIDIPAGGCIESFHGGIHWQQSSFAVDCKVKCKRVLGGMFHNRIFLSK
jgi:hypothetical protein